MLFSASNMYTLQHESWSETVTGAPLHLLQCHSKFLVQFHMLHLDRYGITSFFFYFLDKILVKHMYHIFLSYLM